MDDGDKKLEAAFETNLRLQETDVRTLAREVTAMLDRVDRMLRRLSCRDAGGHVPDRWWCDLSTASPPTQRFMCAWCGQTYDRHIDLLTPQERDLLASVPQYRAYVTRNGSVVYAHDCGDLDATDVDGIAAAG